MYHVFMGFNYSDKKQKLNILRKQLNDALRTVHDLHLYEKTAPAGEDDYMCYAETTLEELFGFVLTELDAVDALVDREGTDTDLK